MKLHHLVYISRTETVLSEDDTSQIEAASLRNNAQCDVSGFLMGHTGFVVQVLEGPRAAVSRLFFKIMQDLRHCNCTLVLAHDISHRSFIHAPMRVVRPTDEVRDNLAPYLKTGVFDPYQMSAAMIWDMIEQIAAHDVATPDERLAPGA